MQDLNSVALSSSQFQNFQQVLLTCPSCDRDGSVVWGAGLHPAKSPVCPSAMADGSVDWQGGVFQLSVISGVSKYFKYPPFEESFSSTLSFYTLPIKRQERNVRLVGQDRGRVEIWKG